MAANISAQAVCEIADLLGIPDLSSMDDKDVEEIRDSERGFMRVAYSNAQHGGMILCGNKTGGIYAITDGKSSAYYIAGM